MSKPKSRKEGAYSSLTGFKRAVPIILVALALFTGLCFITQNTGALGNAISNIFLGLFSIGGYFIPFLLLVHAFFYPSDVQRKRVLSRVIFSVITVIAISAMVHAITYFGEVCPFDVKKFYTDGVNGKGGGFIGSIISFCLMKIFGSVGVIIIAIMIFALYITYFFTTGKAAISKVLLKLLNAISDFFARLDKKHRNKCEKKQKKSEEKKLEEIASRQEKLFDDEFFEVDNGLSELKIEELGIVETRDKAEIERRPSLQNKVIHEEEKIIKSENHSSPSNYEEEKPVRRTVNLDYSTVNSRHGLSLSVSDSSYEPREDDIIYKEPEAESPAFTEENADSIFKKDFDPFDIKLNQELSVKQSSKAKSEPEEKAGISEFAEPLITVSEADIEKARQRADFEMKKKAAIEAQAEYDKAHTPQDKEETEKAEAEEPVTSQNAPYVPEYMSAKSAEEVMYNSYRKAEETPDATDEQAFEYSDNTSEQEDTEPYEEIFSETPEEVKSEPVHPSRANSQNSYKRAAEFAKATARVTSIHESSGSVFKPYTPPTTEPIKQELKSEEVQQNADELRITRNMLDPQPFEKEEPTSQEYFDNDDGNVEITANTGRVDFEFEAQNDDDGYIEEILSFDSDDTEEFSEPFDSLSSVPEEDITPEFEEIPEEEQSEEVKNLRKLFPFLDENPPEENSEIVETDENNAAEFEFDSEDEEAEPEDDGQGRKQNKLFNSLFMQEEKPKEEKADEPALPEKPDYSDYIFPSVELLSKGKYEEDFSQEEEKNANADKLVDTLSQFGVRVSIKGIDRGPRITRYEIVPARGVKVNSVTNLFNDIALNLGAEGIRMEAPIPGKSAIGVEIPNKKASTVVLRDLVESDEFIRGESKTLSCLGKDVTGNPVFADISKMPHVLIAGATGMGKSVCINSILISILYKARPDEVKFIMIDPKKVEFNGYNGIPHLLVPVVTDVKQAAGALMWAVEQMEKRYELMEKLEVRKLDAYNEKVRENPSLGEPLPKIIIVIDELNDIMLQVRKPAEDLIMSIAQKARAAGIHLIIGTQRPSVDVITGVIKANIPSRISCKVASFNDSKTILEQAGAEKLLNNGDMLYIPAGAPKALRVQGAFVSDGEVAAVMKFLKTQAKGNIYDTQALEEINKAAQKCTKGNKSSDDFDDDGEGNEKNQGILSNQQFLDAVEVAIRSNKVSTSLLQRKINVGFSKAAKFIDYMEEFGIVSEPNGQKPRDVLITKDEWHEMLARRSLD